MNTKDLDGRKISHIETGVRKGWWDMIKAQPKHKPIRDPKLLAWIRKQRCAKCGMAGFRNNPIVAGHTNPLKTRGTATKPDDIFALPIHHAEHMEEHRGNKTFWDGLDVPMLIIEQMLRYSRETGKTINGFSVANFLLKMCAENWGG